MSQQDNFVKPCSVCVNPNFKFPPITAPGMPNFVLGTFGATLAGINYALQFIPPTPTIVANLKPPSLSLFTAAFMASLNLPGVTAPELPSLPHFDPTAALKLVEVCIQLPFQLIVKLVDGLLQLKINIPTIPEITLLFNDIAISAGLDVKIPAIGKFGGCLAESIADLFSALV